MILGSRLESVHGGSVAAKEARVATTLMKFAEPIGVSYTDGFSLEPGEEDLAAQMDRIL